MKYQPRKWLSLVAAVLTFLLLSTPVWNVSRAATNTPVSGGTVVNLQDVEPITVSNAAQIGQLARMGNGTATTLAYSPDGTTLAVGGSLGVWVYDVSGQPKGLWAGHKLKINAVAYSPDSRLLAMGSEDKTVKVADRAAFSPDGTQLAIAGYGQTIQVLNIKRQ